MSTEQDSRRLTVVLNDHSAQWSEIRSAMKAKAQRGGRACTNHALVKSITSYHGDSDKNLNSSMHTAEPPIKKLDGQAAKVMAGDNGDEEDVLTALDKKMDRRESLSSQKGSRRNSSQRSSRRGFRQRRSSAKSCNSSGRSIRPGLLFSNSSFNVSTNSVDIMDFGVSQRAVNAALDESARTSASLDDDVLEELQEEFGVNNERSSDAAGGSSRKVLLLSWRNDDSSLRLLGNGGLDESTRSEGDLEFTRDCDGIIGWPSIAAVKDKDRIIEELEAEKETQEPKWNIEDYAYEGTNIDSSGNSRGLRESLTKKLQTFTRRGSHASSVSESSGDLSKIKQTLLNAKNREKKMVDNSDTNRPVGKPLLHFFRKLSSEEVRSSLRSSTRSDADEASRHEPIWVRGGDSDSDEGDHYKDMYGPKPTNR